MEKSEEFVAVLFCPETGGRAEYKFSDHLEDDGSYNAFCWSDGNFSCDCNRFLFLRPGQPDEPCSDGRVIIERIYRTSNPSETLYSEPENAKK